MFFDLVGSLSIAIKVSPSKQIELYANLTLRSQVTFNDQKLVVNGDLCVWVCVCCVYVVKLFGGNPVLETFRIL